MKFFATNAIDYLYIARPDHWPKNILILPGCLFAGLILRLPVTSTAIIRIVLITLCCCLLSSANYAINEWLDARSDAFHPSKKNRPGAAGRLKAPIVLAEYAVLAAGGLVTAYKISVYAYYDGLAYLLFGLIYNVRPVRAKDIQFFDVIIEAANNPIRFIFGWLALAESVFPPSSILLAYWGGGGFLMSVKRYAEYGLFESKAQAGMYRKSFKGYTRASLMLSIVFYAIFSSFFLGVFLIKYRIEFILLFPFITAMFVWYLAIGMRPLSVAQSPEKLFREKKFFLYIVFLLILTVALSFIDIPECNVLLAPLGSIR